MDAKTEAARLMDTDEATGTHGWPLACYVSEAIENELDAFSQAEKARAQDDRFRLAVRRALLAASRRAPPDLRSE